MSSTLGPITIAVTALEEAPVGRLVRRGGARLKDLSFVTGTIGDETLGLPVVLGTISPARDRKIMRGRCAPALPEPRGLRKCEIPFRLIHSMRMALCVSP